jgi:hypothetical protein
MFPDAEQSEPTLGGGLPGGFACNQYAETPGRNNIIPTNVDNIPIPTLEIKHFIFTPKHHLIIEYKYLSLENFEKLL